MNQGSFNLTNQFVAIKVKKQVYLGNPATVIYMNNCTKKIREKFYLMSEQEKK